MSEESKRDLLVIRLVDDIIMFGTNPVKVSSALLGNRFFQMYLIVFHNLEKITEKYYSRRRI